MRKLSAWLAAFAFALTTLAPVAEADARDRRGHGYWERGYHGDYDRRRWRHRDRDRGDALAAGAVGLIVGLALGSLASQDRRDNCYDSYRRCASPAPRCHDPCRYDGGYYQGREPYYDDRRSAYERDYYEGGYYEDTPQCTRRVQLWDRREGRYVWVDEPC